MVDREKSIPDQVIDYVLQGGEMPQVYKDNLLAVQRGCIRLLNDPKLTGLRLDEPLPPELEIRLDIGDWDFSGIPSFNLPRIRLELLGRRMDEVADPQDEFSRQVEEILSEGQNQQGKPDRGVITELKEAGWI